MAWLSTPSMAARSRRLMSRTWASRSGVGVIKKKRRGCCDEKRGQSARPAPTVRRVRAQKYEIPRLLRKSRRLLRKNAQLFAKTGLLFSPSAHGALPHRPPCAENPQVGVENARARHIKTHFRLQKRPLTTEKCFTYDSASPQNNKKTTPFGLHLSTTRQKAR